MRDFADGSQIAHVIRYYLNSQYKGMVHTHNYVETSNKSVKIENWTMLNQRVLSKLGMSLTKEEIVGVTSCQYLMIETVLVKVKKAIDAFNRNPMKDFSSAKAEKYVHENLANSKDPRRNSLKKRDMSLKARSPRSATRTVDTQNPYSKRSEGSTPRA